VVRQLSTGGFQTPDGVVDLHNNAILTGLRVVVDGPALVLAFRYLRDARVDAPQANVPGSQYHVQGPNQGDPGLNLDGTFHDGDPGWSRWAYEWLYDHGWSWPVEYPPAGDPPTHRDW
jgi:hypothetical protein